MRILELLEEDNGRLSNTRMNSTVMIWAGVAIMVGCAFKVSGANLDANSIAASMGLVTAGAGQKLIQKVQESKSEDTQDKVG